MTAPAGKVVFVDRDGVINKDPGGWTPFSYVTKWDEFSFLPGALEALKLLKERGVRVIVISNQAGVGKGYFSESDLEAVDRRMREEVRVHGGEIAASFYCIHQEEASCACRKPKTGLIEKAIEKYRLDTKGASFIGDTERDMIAGRAAGLRTILILSGKATREDTKGWAVRPDRVCEDLKDAVRTLMDEEGTWRRT